MDTNTSFRIEQMSPQLIVADIDRSIRFYTEKIGFELDFRFEDFYAGITKDGHSIHFKLGKPSIEERENKRNHEDVDITFSVDRIEHLYKELSNTAIEIVQRLRHMPYGKEFYVADPDGYIIAFFNKVVITADILEPSNTDCLKQMAPKRQFAYFWKRMGS